jgi:hypothetical protein
MDKMTKTSKPTPNTMSGSTHRSLLTLKFSSNTLVNLAETLKPFKTTKHYNLNTVIILKLKALYLSHFLRRILTDSSSYPSNIMISGKCIRTNKLLSGQPRKSILPKT